MIHALIQTILLLPVFVFNSWFTLWLHKRRQKQREVKFLKQLSIISPTGTSTTFVSVETSDKKAMDDIIDQWCTHMAKGGVNAK